MARISEITDKLVENELELWKDLKAINWNQEKGTLVKDVIRIVENNSDRTKIVRFMLYNLERELSR